MGSTPDFSNRNINGLDSPERAEYAGILFNILSGPDRRFSFCILKAALSLYGTCPFDIAAQRGNSILYAVVPISRSLSKEIQSQKDRTQENSFALSSEFEVLLGAGTQFFCWSFKNIGLSLVQF